MECVLQGLPRTLRAFGRASPTPRFPRKRMPEKAHPMTQNYENLVSTVETVRADMEKAEKGNKAATSRVRKSMQEVKAIAQEIRKEMLELRDAGGVES